MRPLFTNDLDRLAFTTTVVAPELTVAVALGASERSNRARSEIDTAVRALSILPCTRVITLSAAPTSDAAGLDLPESLMRTVRLVARGHRSDLVTVLPSAGRRERDGDGLPLFDVCIEPADGPARTVPAHRHPGRIAVLRLLAWERATFMRRQLAATGARVVR